MGTCCPSKHELLEDKTSVTSPGPGPGLGTQLVLSKRADGRVLWGGVLARLASQEGLAAPTAGPQQSGLRKGSSSVPASSEARAR